MSLHNNDLFELSVVTGTLVSDSQRLARAESKISDLENIIRSMQVEMAHLRDRMRRMEMSNNDPFNPPSPGPGPYPHYPQPIMRTPNEFEPASNHPAKAQTVDEMIRAMPLNTRPFM